MIQTQNDPGVLAHLHASRYWYRWGRRTAATQMLLAIPAPIAISAIVAAQQNPDARAFSVAFGISASLLDALVLDPAQQALRQRGAKEQEMFDCQVLELPWPELRGGERPLPEETTHASRKYRGTPLTNWYPPETQGLDDGVARLACQRLNAWWDADLRKKWQRSILVLILATFAIVLGVGWNAGRRLPELVTAVYAPVAPLVLWAFRERRRHQQAGALSERIRDSAQKAMDRAIAEPGDEVRLAAIAREIQDSLFDRPPDGSVSARYRPAHAKRQLPEDCH
jgi:hypothetical protein